MSDDPKQEEMRVGVYICHCGSNIAGVIPPGEVAEWASTLPGVVRATDTLYACADSGQTLIKEDIKKVQAEPRGGSRLHGAHARAHLPRRVSDAGLNPFLMEMANIREQDTWVHAHDPEGALRKAKELMAAAVAKAQFLAPLEIIKVPVTKRAMVIGGGVAGISAALDLADMGIETYLVEKEPSIGGTMAQLNKTFPTMDCSI